ncbi:MAG: SpaA isopeptide-forming pilin-related protein [Anaerotignum faecicola]
MTIGKKIVSVFLSFLMLFSVCVEAFAGTSMETALNKVNLYVKEESKGQLLTWKGVIDARNFAPDVIVYKAEDGKEYPAFCANPNKGGVENFAAKNYDVDVDGLDKDPHVWGAITNGYPYKTPAELGVKNAYEAYYITKMAVWAIVHDNYSNLNDWKANGSQNNHVEKAMKALVAKGRANTAVYPTWLAVNPKSTTVSVDEKDSNYISQTYTLKSNVDIKSYRVVIDGNVPAGAKVTDVSNKEKTEFFGSELTFKVLIPKDSPKGEFRVLVKSKLENKSVLFGVAHDEKKQNYYVSPLPSYNGDSWAQLAYAPEGGDVPDTPETPTTDVQILKVKKGTTEGLAGAVFKVEVDGKTIGHYVTDKKGEIKIEKVSGTLSVTEEVPPKGYVLDENNHKDVEIRNNDEPTVITFANEEQAQLEVVKIDADTGDKLEGAVIRVAYDGGNDFWDLHTNASGKASLSNLKSGTYSVKEISAPAGYLLNDTVQTVKLEAGKTASVTLKNKEKPGILIKKYDEDTGMPLPDAEFSVAKKGGSIVYEGMTDKSGQMKVENLSEGWYTITEIAAPKGYLIADKSKDVYLEGGKCVAVKFDNRLRPSLQLMKLDAKTNEPLAGAKFKVTKTEDKTVSEYVTDQTGTVVIRDLDEAVYTVEEIQAPNGYTISTENHKDIALEWGKTKTLIFTDTRKPTLIITKTNALTNKGVPDTVFKIQREKADGGVVTLGTYKTDANGQIVLKGVDAGWYVITEVRAAQGMSLPSNPVTRKYLAEGENAYTDLKESTAITDTDKTENTDKNTVKITSGNDYGEEIPNYPLNSIVIKKTDANTSKLLAGAAFEVRKVSGDISGNSGTIIGRYTTDDSGIIVITGLEAGAYIIEEVQPPANYLLSENSKQQAWLKADGTSVVEVTFANYPYGHLLITKTDADTKKPLAGAKFKVTTADGTVVGNANGEFITDSNGEILIPNVKPDSYVVTEIQAPEGYEISEEAKTIQVGTDGGTYQLRFADRALNGLVISKIDEETREPIKNVTFEVSKMNGERIGTYRTDSDGKIALSNLESGWYTVIETKAAKGYALDSEPKHIEVKNGKQALLTVTNRQTSSMLIHKIDAVTGEGIYGVTFLVSDAKHNPIGQYTSDQNGYVYIDRELKDGKYYVQEIQPAEGYLVDHTKKIFYVEYGETSHITWKNTPQMGQIQITKKSADDNPINGLTAGTLLPDAVFEIYSRAGNLVDTVKTDKNGRAVSKTLPLGRYVIRETKAPNYYIAEKTEINAEIAFSGQIVRLEVLNKSCYTNVSVTKRGYNQIVPGQEVRYTFTNIKNNSTVPLNSFYWRDTLPVNAARLEKIITGTWNQRLSYKIVYKTNLNGTYRTLADNLSTAENRVISASPAALGLASNEYVTEVMFVFGTVKSGFAQVETPYIYCKALSNLSHEYRFANKTDVGGLWNGQWIMGNDSFVTVVYGKKTTKVLPRTGY